MTPILRRRGWSALALVVAAAVSSACAASDPPPTSPLDEGAADVTAVATPPSEVTSPVSTITPFATPASDAAAEAERITGEAIARIAEWTGAPETEFRLTSIEAVEWPDACLGIAVPATACADVITPGYRVTLHHVSAPSRPYLIHTSKAGNYAWAPSHGPLERVVAAVDPGAGAVILAQLDASEDGGEDEMGELQRVAPGSLLAVGLSELAPGQRVSIGTADSVDGGAGLIVVLAPLAE